MPFFEDVALRRLTAAGVRHTVLMMDSKQCAACIQDEPPLAAGRAYTLIPISMQGAFHPKLWILAGPSKLLILIGSHNLTFAGVACNRELTTAIRVEGPDDSHGLSLASQVWEVVESWLQMAEDHVPRHALDMAKRVKSFCPWLKDTQQQHPESEISVLGTGGDLPTLWQQVQGRLQSPCVRVRAFGAFFDHDLRFLKQVEEQLAPESMTVGIQPETVEGLPYQADSRWQWVNANNLAVGAGADASSYLHAKALSLELENGEELCICGSANPSYPAWIGSEGYGNAEMMILRRGQSGADAADELGLAALDDAPELRSEEWRAIKDRHEQRQAEDAATPGIRTGIAEVDDGQIQLSSSLLAGLPSVHFYLDMDLDRRDVLRPLEQSTTEVLLLDVDPGPLAAANYLDAVDETGELKAKFVLHRSHELQGKARTNKQRRLSDALASLETDTPDFEVFLNSVQKILFSEESNKTDIRPKRSKPTSSPADNGQDKGGFGIDIEDVPKKKKARDRLDHDPDMLCLLDALIFQLKADGTVLLGATDAFGRSEEEQVGADDEDPTPAQPKGEISERIRRACEQKLNVMMRRMGEQLKGYAQAGTGKVAILTRLLGVLSVLRHLRKVEPEFDWSKKHASVLSKPALQELFVNIIVNVQAAGRDFLDDDDVHHSVAESEDIERLRQLTLWLAWDIGVEVQVEPRFNESPDERKSRLHTNATLLGLARSFMNDPDSIPDAAEMFVTAEVDALMWLERIRSIAENIQQFACRHESGLSAANARPGDIAFHAKLPGPWVIKSPGDGGMIEMIPVDSDAKGLRCRADKLQIERATTILRSHV
ncbi:phospholipase D-like domain-containing protein [Salinisphaera orenii]|uniref:hypothetical protein n=1 Tax=Salinisphaera orenii TaxID=856731 RepID=UPI0013A65D3E